MAEQSEPSNSSSRTRSKSLDEGKSTVEENLDKKDYHAWDASDVNRYFDVEKVWEILDQPVFKTSPKAKEVFKERKFSGKDLDSLDEDKLRKMNIENNAAQALILEMVRGLQKESGHPPPPAPPSMGAFRPLLPEWKVFYDPIHGAIELHPLLVKIIDTPQFQRLRDIKQMGCTYWVYHGAAHNRFEHSIGVCHVAGKLVETLQRKHEGELDITNKDVLCVKIAGLCHDLGRGPFSHVFEKLYQRSTSNANWKFEQASVMMFEHLINENEEVRKELQEERIGPDEIEFIKCLIFPERRHSCPSSKEFLLKIVVNRETAIDAVTLDCIARDSYHCLGTPCNHMRLVKFARIGGDESCICFRDKEAHNLYDMLTNRLSLTRKLHQHKTVRVIEEMLIDALKKADSLLELTKTVKTMVSEDEDDTNRHRALCRFTRLTDSVVDRIKDSDSTEQSLKKAQEKLEQIERRHLYKYIGVALNDQPRKEVADRWEESLVDDMIRETVRSIQDSFRGKVTEEDVLIDPVVFYFGTEVVQNPVDKIWFYSKLDPNRTFHIKRDQVSQMLPERFTEIAIRVYSTKPELSDWLKVERCFKEGLERTKGWTWESYTPYASPEKTSGPPAQGSGSPVSAAKRSLTF